MYASVTYNAVRTIHSGDAPATFSGSGRFTSNDASTFVEKPKPTFYQEKKKKGLNVKTTTYKLNKPKIRRKIDAFFWLRATKEFCAFYSVSFPEGFTDDDAFTVWNICLTRCRAAHGLHSYIWVSERQQNGTIHFHMLTNTRMPIRDVNGYVAESISKYHSVYRWNHNMKEKYNGVDVDNIWYPKTRKGQPPPKKRTRDEAERIVRKYVTKYVSKNDSVFEHLCWHESRDISALFTAQNFDEGEQHKLLDYFWETKDSWKKFESKYVTVYLHTSYVNFQPYLSLISLNNRVFDYMNPPPE